MTAKQCGAMQPTPTAMTDYITCYCSLPVGHGGGHVSRLVNGQVIGIWPSAEPSRFGELIPDVVDVLAESTATRRTADRHDDESGQT